MTLPLRCSTCSQPVTAEPVRICLDCGKPIRRGHKFQVDRDGLRHKCCAWPSCYTGPEQYLAAHGEATWRRGGAHLYPGVDLGTISAYPTSNPVGDTPMPKPLSRAKTLQLAPELIDALRNLVLRCDGDEGVRADGSNIDTCQAHAVLTKLEAL